jgi:hypothetical protein
MILPFLSKRMLFKPLITPYEKILFSIRCKKRVLNSLNSDFVFTLLENSVKSLRYSKRSFFVRIPGVIFIFSFLELGLVMYDV